MGRQRFIKRKHIEESNKLFESRASNSKLIKEQNEVNCGLCGDADGDGIVTSQDASLVLQYTFTNGAVNVPCLDYVDVSGDGSVNEVDAQLILDYVAGNITEFPGCSDSSDETTTGMPGNPSQMNMAVSVLAQQGPVCCDHSSDYYGHNAQGVLLQGPNSVNVTDTYLMTGMGDTTYCDNSLCSGPNPDDFSGGPDGALPEPPNKGNKLKDRRKKTDIKVKPRKNIKKTDIKVKPRKRKSIKKDVIKLKESDLMRIVKKLIIEEKGKRN